MYKITFENLNNNNKPLTTKLGITSIVISILNHFDLLQTNSLLKKTEDLYNSPNHILFIKEPVAQYGFPVFNVRKNLLYTSKI